jgi:hypothetical protein
LIAVPAVGYQFDKWSGDIDNNTANNSTIVVTMDKVRDITADFTAPGGLYTITVNTNSFQGGSATIKTSFGTYVTSANQTSISIQCVAGTVVNITAAAARNHSFIGWKGGVTGSQGNMSFVVNSSKSITAEFSLPSSPSSFPWSWVAGGIAALLLVAILVVRFISGRAEKPDDIPPMSLGDSNFPHADVPE